MLDLLQYTIKFLNKEQIPYLLTGSMAMSIYTVPRSTRDFDFIIEITEADIQRISKHFKYGYYCEEQTIREAIHQQGMFNVIEHATGFKIDFIVLSQNEFEQSKFKRRKKVEMHGLDAYIISAEDLIISKLIWIQELQSALQMEDIVNLVGLDKLDWHFINYWINKLHLNTFGLIQKA